MSQTSMSTMLQLPGKRVASGFNLPPERLAKARERLVRFIVFMGIISAAVTVATYMFDLGELSDRLTPAIVRGILIAQITIILAHVAFYFVARSSFLSHSTVLMLGLGYEVIVCYTVTVGDQWLTHHVTGFLQDTTFAHLLIVVYPLIVPSPPARTLVASLVAAGAVLIGIFTLTYLDVELLDHQYVAALFPLSITVALAVYGSAVLHGMHREVTEAQELGSYQLETMLGKGGMGEVWKAKHRLLARPAAIKLVRPEILGDGGGESTLLKRFEREAQATAQLSSPHTIDIFDFGISDEGTFYYVMELLQGLDLGTLVERFGPLRASRAIYLLRQICDSLAEAHVEGLIHRDVKPANVYVCRYGLKSDFVKVLDFGLVKATGSTQTDVKLTQEHTVGGTPAFMAPEQVRGNRPVDGRTDIYALGCVAYWLLTGVMVFEGGTPMETMLQHVQKVPASPASRAELPVSPELDAVVMACLAKEPEERPQSAQDLASRLLECPESSRWGEDRAADWWDRHLPS